MAVAVVVIAVVVAIVTRAAASHALRLPGSDGRQHHAPPGDPLLELSVSLPIIGGGPLRDGPSRSGCSVMVNGRSARCRRRRRWRRGEADDANVAKSLRRDDASPGV